MEAWKCIASEEYERIRGLAAWNLTSKATKRKNQHATIYTFDDHSKLIVYSFGCYAYRGTDGYMYARRTEYSKSDVVEFSPASLKILGIK